MKVSFEDEVERKYMINKGLKEYNISFKDFLDIIDYKNMVFYGDRESLKGKVSSFIDFLKKQLKDLNDN